MDKQEQILWNQKIDLAIKEQDSSVKICFDDIYNAYFAPNPINNSLETNKNKIFIKKIDKNKI